VQNSFAQPFSFKNDSLSSARLSTSYFDVFRTKNSLSSTLLSLQKTSAEFETASGSNKLFFSLLTEKNIIQISNSVSQINFRAGQSINRLTLDNEFSFTPFFAELFLRVNQITHVSFFDYGGSFGFKNSSHWFEKFRIGYYRYSFPSILGLKYEDSEMVINNLAMLSKIFYEIGFHPVDKTLLTFQYEKYKSSKNKNENPAFAVEDKTSGSFTRSTVVNSSCAIPVEIAFSHAEGESICDLLYSQNSFSQNLFSDILYNSVGVKSYESQKFLWLPSFSVDYHFLKGSLVGNIQSWPFTSVLTSFIANRLNYRLDGHLYLFSFKARKQFVFSSLSVQPELSFYQILPEITLDTWQPSYIVFGVKDFSRNILPIRKAILGKISISATYQFKTWEFVLQVGQFLPIQIVKKELPPSVVSPGIATVQSSPSKFDGGHWITVSICSGF